MFELSHIGAAAFLLALRSDGQFAYSELNATMERLTGFKRADLSGRSVAEVFGAEVGERVAAAHARCVSTKAQVEYETSVSGPRGTVTYQSTLTPIIEADGTVDTIFGVTADITERKSLENKLRSSNLRLNLAIEALGGAHWFYDTLQQTFELSPAFDKLLGASVPRAMGVDEWLEYVIEEDRNDTCFADLLAGRIEQGTAEFRVQSGNGDIRWMRCRRRSTQDASGVTGIAGVVIDITGEKRHQADLSRQASSDAMTGLANRRGFDEMPATQRGTMTSLLIIDVDEFKAYNDIYGHVAGDVALKHVADLLKRTAIAHGGLAARYGGEEFAVILPNRDAADASWVAESILRGMKELALPHAGSAVESLRVSIGVATANALDRSAPPSLVALADDALYQAKSGGRACYRRADQTTQARNAA